MSTNGKAQYAVCSVVIALMMVAASASIARASEESVEALETMEVVPSQDLTAGCCRASWGLKDGPSYRSKGTGYYPYNNSMEGGYIDRRGNPLKTLQSFLKRGAAWVSTAMDANAFAYGTKICIPEINSRYGAAVPFKVVDTGGAFRGKGTSRIDVCTASQSASLDTVINGRLTITVCK